MRRASFALWLRQALNLPRMPLRERIEGAKCRYKNDTFIIRILMMMDAFNPQRTADGLMHRLQRALGPRQGFRGLADGLAPMAV